jgi:hypothetical protein
MAIPFHNTDLYGDRRLEPRSLSSPESRRLRPSVVDFVVLSRLSLERRPLLPLADLSVSSALAKSRGLKFLERRPLGPDSLRNFKSFMSVSLFSSSSEPSAS